VIFISDHDIVKLRTVYVHFNYILLVSHHHSREYSNVNKSADRARPKYVLKFFASRDSVLLTHALSTFFTIFICHLEPIIIIINLICQIRNNTNRFYK